jgi:hypothetical protein
MPDDLRPGVLKLMRYLIFEDTSSKTFHPVIMSNHIDPAKVTVDGMRLSSGGDVNISPDARFSVQPSEFYRYDESDHQFVGATIGGLDESEFKKKRPVLLFKFTNESTVRRAYSLAELLELPGFPDNVSWVSNAAGAPEFDRFFEITEDGVSVKKQVVHDLNGNSEYLDTIKKDPTGVSGFLVSGAVTSRKNDNIVETGDSPDDSQTWRYSPVTGSVYWYNDAGDEANALVTAHLRERGYRVSKHVTINFQDLESEKPEEKPSKKRKK